MLVPAAVQSEQGRYLLGAVNRRVGALLVYSRTYTSTYLDTGTRSGRHREQAFAGFWSRSHASFSAWRSSAHKCLGPTKAPRPDPGRQRNNSKGSKPYNRVLQPRQSRLSLAVREAAGDVASVAALRDRCPAGSHSVDPFC